MESQMGGQLPLLAAMAFTGKMGRLGYNGTRICHTTTNMLL